MENNIIPFGKDSKSSEELFTNLTKLYSLKNELKALDSIESQCEKIFDYFYDTFLIKCMRFTAYTSMDTKGLVVYETKNASCSLDKYMWDLTVYHRGSKNIKLVISFLFDSQKELKTTQRFYELIESIMEDLSSIIKLTLVLKHYEHISTVDEVTGVFNRRFLVDYLHKILPLADREKHNIGFMMIAIDRFKAVIEEFNYDIADKVLAALSLSLKNSVRESDIIARIDSDNFIVVLPKVETENDIITVAKKCIDNFAEVKVEVKKDQFLQKSICIGTVMYRQDAHNLEDIFKNLDMALDEAKNLGRSEVFKYSDINIGECNFF